MRGKLEEYIKYSSDIIYVKKAIRLIKTGHVEQILDDFGVKKFIDDAQFSVNIGAFVDSCGYTFHKKYLNKLNTFCMDLASIKCILESDHHKNNNIDANILKCYISKAEDAIPDLEYYFDYMDGGCQVPHYSVLFEFVIGNLFYICIIIVVAFLIYTAACVYSSMEPYECSIPKKNKQPKEVNYKYPYFEDSDVML